jgi:hypothetical protein
VVLDRGFDRRNLFRPLAGIRLAFVARLVGDRHVQTADGRSLAVVDLAEQLRPARLPRPWPRGGYSTSCPVRLPEVSDEEFLLVVGWRWPGSRPALLLVSPPAWRPARTARWFVKAYRRRWGVEDATRGIKQRFALESFLVRSWRSIRRLVWLVAWAFWWLNLWGEERYEPLRTALLSHPWRLPKAVTYLFDWIAGHVHQLLHPRPRVEMPPGRHRDNSREAGWAERGKERKGAAAAEQAEPADTEPAGWRRASLPVRTPAASPRRLNVSTGRMSVAGRQHRLATAYGAGADLVLLLPEALPQ